MLISDERETMDVIDLDLIDRVAYAIYIADVGGKDWWDLLSEDRRAHYHRLASAALVVMADV